MSRPYRVVLFDLFGTVVYFAAPLASPARAPFEWLQTAWSAERPAIPFDEFRRALVDVSAAIGAARAPEHREVPSRERFRRALERLGAGDDVAMAERLSLSHMAHLASRTELPPAHADLLRDLAARHRLGLVSNFDHGATAQAILARHGVHRYFDVTLISDDFGQRKPHPAIFREALHRIGAEPADALYVGDSATDDVAGAQAVGLDVAWIDREGAEPPAPPPTYTLRTLPELRRVLGLARASAP